MDISPNEAEEALTSIDVMAQKTCHSIASSGAHTSLIITGAVWMVGFLATQFLQGQIVAYIWIGASIIGATLGIVLNMRIGKRMRNPTAGVTAKRIGTVWLLLAVYCLAALAITWPLDGMQLTVLIVLFVMVGWLAMGLLLSFISVWPGLVIIALVLIGYFFLIDIFYLWMAILGGGGMIALGLYIRYRW
jgi:hypothetical protein